MCIYIHPSQQAAASKGGASAQYIPYRSSKITRILQNSLGGNALSTIICTMTPSAAQVGLYKRLFYF